ncbi:glycoside hydrolase family 65 protein [Lacticaseibacillus zhaodongensis]|uniref:glycoside hydrolase family 65 protein n=1 Tax=Lacticaseibacillus zhaodongensis TaxID=2668065 RepID=UPI0012D2E6EF|nr:glycosyl hydrolase family 65 protein [Lacticaseibacillus zhaodongensis]
MKTISLKVSDEVIELDYATGADAGTKRHVSIAYITDQSVGDNLENIKVQLAGVDFDTIILENPLSYAFSDTIVGINHRRIDIGLALTNMFNVPVLSRNAVNKLGLEEAYKQKLDYDGWHLDYYGQYSGKRNYGQEALLTVGNGYLGLRGAYIASQADADNYPGMYVAGVYNQNTSNINGKDVTNEDLVNLPNAQYMSFGVDKGEPFAVHKRTVDDVYRSLDLHTGMLTTSMIITLATGHKLLLQEQKVADMHDWHHFAIKVTLTPINWSGSLQIYTGIDGSVINANVDRYAQFDQRHFDVTGMSSAGTDAFLSGRTKHSNIDFTIGTRVTMADRDIAGDMQATTENDKIEQRFSVPVQQGKSYSFEKTVAVYTSNDVKAEQLAPSVEKELNAASFASTFAHTRDYYSKVWNECDIRITGDVTSQKLSRVNIVHLFTSAAALASGKIDASIGARGLHGEAYRGHVFWDEMFALPFYTLHYPELAKQMLFYRYRRLPAARAAAKAVGKRGAMFPWQSGQKGDEQSQSTHYNPVSKKWDPDNSHLQRHVSLAVDYDVWFYTHVSGDKDFMNQYGLEILLDTAQFWLSMCEYDAKDGRYHIRRVMGPDKFHEQYPNAAEYGLSDNAYTNMAVVWLFNLVADLRTKVSKARFTELSKQLGISAADYQAMAKVSSKLALGIKGNIIGQFAGYFKLARLDFDKYRKHYGDISRLDRILKAEGKTPDAYQVAKQADTLMPLYNWNRDTVDGILKQMGYKLDKDYPRQNLLYYLDRTTHGSTLSRIVYAALEEENGDSDSAWQLFRQALFSDYYDIQGGTTAEGIHLGVMGATLNVLTRVYGGVDVRGDHVVITPRLPESWQQLHFAQTIRGTKLTVTITATTITLLADHDLAVQVGDQQVQLKAGKQQEVPYPEVVTETEAS